MGIPYFWCERRDLNPYESPHTPLKRARLPIPPLSHIPIQLYWYIGFTVCLKGEAGKIKKPKHSTGACIIYHYPGGLSSAF